jgi:hypothetical protein
MSTSNHNEQQQQQFKLVLPQDHPLSLKLALQALDLEVDIREAQAAANKARPQAQAQAQAPLPASFLRHVQSCRVLSPGLVELVIQLRVDSTTTNTTTTTTTTNNGYASRSSWPVRVGGAGIGDDAFDDFEFFDTNTTNSNSKSALSAMLGTTTRRAPVAVRFAIPIALGGVDDAGFCDGSFFWEDTVMNASEEEEDDDGREEEEASVTLRGIAQTLVSWLQGRHLPPKPTTMVGGASDDQQQMKQQRREEWETAEQHMSQRLDVIRQYQEIMESRGDASLLLPERVALDGRSSSSSSSSNKRGRYHILPEWISPDFRSCFDPAAAVDDRKDWKRIVTEIGPGIYSFPLFTHEFCDLLVQEVDSFESTSLPCRRPNTMNRLGLVVNDIGLEPVMTDLVELLLAPMCRALYPDEVITCALDHHHSFVVRYQNDDDHDHDHDDDDDEKKDTNNDSGNSREDRGDHDEYNNRGLDMHHDASEATLNVCLGRDDFPSGGLRFCGRFGDSDHRMASHVYSHSKGRAILHLGRHRHGADNIGSTSAERMNLIVWARNSAYRGAAAFGHAPLDGSPLEKEAGEPDRLCLSKANDRDYETQMKRFDTDSNSNNASATSSNSTKRRRRVVTKF